MKLKRKMGQKTSIPTASMADIAFLLLVFFMVTTVFQKDSGIPLNLPEAEAVKKVPKRTITRVWIDKSDRISIDDKLVPVDLVAAVIAEGMSKNPGLLVAIRADKECNYKVVDDVMEQLKRANALRISLIADLER